ncbi:MAG: choice-of-anchor tandem repeat GloVer-containing protein [Rhizomicrobium sp.]
MRIVFGLALGAALLAPAAASAQTLQTFAFPSGTSANPAPKGARSAAGLISDGGFLYGTTSSGANIYTTSPYGCGWSNGCGTVFRLDPATGMVSTIYAFCPTLSCPNGGHPLGGLVFVGGAFYGTTEGGGTGARGPGSGTVFKLTKPTVAKGAWTETAIYSFCSLNACTDGAKPLAGLVGKAGMLYGTTYGGGANNYGTVFELNPATGALTTLYSFCNLTNCADGQWPEASLVFGKGGLLYGTTLGGGANGNGSVFSVSPTTKKMTTIYSFPTVSCPPNKCYPNGQGPYAGLLLGANGTTLYGTTSAGGANNYGAVFALTPPATGHVWTESVLYSFCSLNNCADGYDPVAGLSIDNSGLLYGTTEFGGAGPSYNAGTVFKLDPGDEQLTTLFSFYGVLQGKCPGPCFTAYASGSQPVAGVTVVTGDSAITLYGTTSQGGTTVAKSSCSTDFSGCGTVFALTP